jgi:hypothetical protein
VIGHGIPPALQDIYQGIEDALRRELEKVTLEDVLQAVLAVPH